MGYEKVYCMEQPLLLECPPAQYARRFHKHFRERHIRTVNRDSVRICERAYPDI
jgi:hypothetical protein